MRLTFLLLLSISCGQKFSDFCLGAPRPQQAMEVERQDPEEEEEAGEVGLPLMVLPPFERTSEPTLSDVVAGVLNLLVPIEGVAESGAIGGQDDPKAVNEGYDGEDVSEVVDHPINLLESEPVKEEETMSPLPPKQLPESVDEVGPSSPPREQTIILPSEPISQTLLVTVEPGSTRGSSLGPLNLRLESTSVVAAIHFFNTSQTFLKITKTFLIRFSRKCTIFLKDE